MRRHILDVASDLMTHKGIKETSLKDISKSAGISQGTLYYYYSAKDDIIYDIADANLSAITNDLLACIEAFPDISPPSEILKTLMERILAEETRGKLHQYLLSHVITNEKLRKKFHVRYQTWRTMLEDAIGQVIGKRPDNKYLAIVIIATLDGLLIQRSCGHYDTFDGIVDILVPKDI